MFRYAVAFDIAKGAILSKTYGSQNTQNNSEASTALLAEAKIVLKEANAGVLIQKAEAGSLRISYSKLIDSLKNNPTLNGASYSNAGNLKASDTTYKYGSLISDNYKTTVAPDKLEVKVNKTSLTTNYSATNKIYDGGTSASVTASSNDIASGDKVSFSNSSATFDNKNAGVAKSVSISGITIGGDDAGNYDLKNTTASTTADVTAKPLTTIYSANSKIYDGGTTASVTASSNDILNGDEVSFSNSSATFGDKNVGIDKPVAITGIAISGDDASNYKLQNLTANTSANITAKTLLPVYKEIKKIFDGNTSVSTTATPSDFGVIGNDDVKISQIANFDTPNVGTNKVVDVKSILLSGADSSNYYIAPTAKAKGTITQVTPAVPAPVIPTTSQIKPLVLASNPFSLASADALIEETCSSNSVENCHCEPSQLNANVGICYEPIIEAKGASH
jgi:hypothetical protein